MAKYASDGTQSWVVRMDPVQDDGFGLTTDSHSNIFVTGQTSGDLGSANAGGTDAFLRKIDPDGAIQWTRQLGTTGNEAGSGVVADGSDSVFVTGATDGALVRPTDGLSDGFLSKYTADGDLIWTRQFGTADADVGHSVSIDSTGDVLVRGYSKHSDTGKWSVVLTKYNTDGSQIFSKDLYILQYPTLAF